MIALKTTMQDAQLNADVNLCFRIVKTSASFVKSDNL